MRRRFLRRNFFVLKEGTSPPPQPCYGEDLKNDGKEAAHVDRKTYEEAVTLHSDTVTRLLLLRCRQPADAEDCYQGSVPEAAHRQRSFPGPGAHQSLAHPGGPPRGGEPPPPVLAPKGHLAGGEPLPYRGSGPGQHRLGGAGHLAHPARASAGRALPPRCGGVFRGGDGKHSSGAPWHREVPPEPGPGRPAEQLQEEPL